MGLIPKLSFMQSSKLVWYVRGSAELASIFLVLGYYNVTFLGNATDMYLSSFHGNNI